MSKKTACAILALGAGFMLAWLSMEPELADDALMLPTATLPKTPQAVAVPAPAVLAPAIVAKGSTVLPACATDALPGTKVGLGDTATAISRSLAQLAEDLSRSSDPKTEKFRSHIQLQSGLIGAIGVFWKSAAACKSNEACQAAALGEFEQSRANLLNPVISQAMGSHDPDTYALAYLVCRDRGGLIHRWPRSESCSQLSATRWRQLAPGSLEAMTAAAHEAMDARDEVATVQALQAISSFPGRLAARLPGYSGMQPIGSFADRPFDFGLIAQAGLELHKHAAPERAIARFCAVRGGRSLEQQQLCRQLLERLETEQNSAQQIDAAAEIAHRMQMPADRVERLDRTAAGLRQAAEAGVANNDCARLARSGRIAVSVLNGTDMQLHRSLMSTR